jgi:hypothetical protein
LSIDAEAKASVGCRVALADERLAAMIVDRDLPSCAKIAVGIDDADEQAAEAQARGAAGAEAEPAARGGSCGCGLVAGDDPDAASEARRQETPVVGRVEIVEEMDLGRRHER